MDSSQPDASSEKKNTSAYAPEFKQHLIDYAIYPSWGQSKNRQKPRNWENLKARLAQPRASLPPSQFTPEAFQNFVDMMDAASDESGVKTNAFPLIAGFYDIPNCQNRLFRNFKHLTDGSLCKAQPDFCDGSARKDLNSQIREQLGPYILPSKTNSIPCLPNFFTELKGPDGNGEVLNNQVLYDGALGARAMHELRSYVDSQTAFDNNAYTIISSFNSDGLLRLYTMHPTLSSDPQKPIEYRMTQLEAFAMTSSLNIFRQGVWAFRNLREWAEEKRQELIAAANLKAKNGESGGLYSSTHSFPSRSTSTEATKKKSKTSGDVRPLNTVGRAPSSRKPQVVAQTTPSPKTSSNQSPPDTVCGIRSTPRTPVGSRKAPSSKSWAAKFFGLTRPAGVSKRSSGGSRGSGIASQ